MTATEKTNLVSYWALDEADSEDSNWVVDKVDETLGSEVLPDPTFDDTTTEASDGTHWSITGVGVGETFDVNTTASGKLVAVAAQDVRLVDYGILTSGVLYRFQITLDSVGDSGRIRGAVNNTMGGISDINLTGAGTYTRYFVADGTTFAIDCDATADFTATDMSVKPVNGNYGKLI